MRAGLLWFDDNPRVTVVAKIENAARRYREKFGRLPDVCYVHPQTLVGVKTLPVQVKVLESPSVLPNHFWIGVNSS